MSWSNYSNIEWLISTTTLDRFSHSQVCEEFSILMFEGQGNANTSSRRKKKNERSACLIIFWGLWNSIKTCIVKVHVSATQFIWHAVTKQYEYVSLIPVLTRTISNSSHVVIAKLKWSILKGVQELDIYITLLSLLSHLKNVTNNV